MNHLQKLFYGLLSFFLKLQDRFHFQRSYGVIEALRCTNLIQEDSTLRYMYNVLSSRLLQSVKLLPYYYNNIIIIV